MKFHRTNIKSSNNHKDWTSGSNNGINLAFNTNNTLDFNTKADGGSREDVHRYESLTPGRCLMTADDVSILSQTNLIPVQVTVVEESGGQSFATAQLIPTPDIGNNVCVINGVSGEATLITSGTKTTTGGLG